MNAPRAQRSSTNSKLLLPLLLVLLLLPSPALASEPIEGTASYYSGGPAATPWCVYPWTTCGWVRVTSLRTGIQITIHVGQYCECYRGTAQERLIDLTPSEVLALGEELSTGLYRITLERLGEVDPTLPNTATKP